MRVARLFTALALVLATAFAHTRASEDGGGRSVFATGAGNRALALGGAYAALANDASSPLWNPGGLGLVLRRELHVTQTSYFGLGLDEQFASLVFPHWRLGTASLTFRHFGADGIEFRDDRNVLVNNDVADNETELLLGYGRSIAEAWSVGGTLKIRHQSLAGFSSSGIGADLGVTVKPFSMTHPNSQLADRLAVGFTIRNVIEPRIRLATEKVSDPLGVRAGVAYHLPIMGNRRVLAALDLEKTGRADLNVHAGMELQVHPLLALRAGISDGVFATGTGVRWRTVTVDYTFEQNNIENIHRVGATLTFGPSVSESRRAALERQENELQAKFEAAFTERQAMRIGALLEQAEDLRRQGDFDMALEILAVAAALEPNHEGTRLLQADCLRELGLKMETEGDYAGAAISYSQVLSIAPNDTIAETSLERVREESDRLAERSETIRREFSTALDAFSMGDLASARNLLSSILEAAPNDAEARAMLDRTLVAIDHHVNELVDRAGRLIEWGQLDEASRLIDEARRLTPNARGVRRVAAMLRTAESNQTGFQTDTPTTTVSDSVQTTKALTDEERREAEHLYRQALAAMVDSRSDEAIRYLELVWSMDPNHQRVVEHLKRQYLTRGMEHFADGELEKAVELWENVLRIDPSDEKAKGYLSRAREQLSKTRQILGQSP